MMIRQILAVLLVIWIASGLPGCAGMQERDKLSLLDRSLRDYASALRWARYMDAHDYLYSPDGSKPGLDMDRYEGYRIAAMNIVRSDLNEDKDEATVYTEIQYYSDKTGTIRKLNEVQHWWYQSDNNRWFLDGDLPTLE